MAPGLRPPACAGPSSGGCVLANGLQMGMLYLGLFTTALGTGGLKSSVSGFGSDQFDESDKIEKKQMMKFFRYFFFFINVGSILAVTVMVYIQDHLGRRWGYGICAVAIIAGLALFLSKTNRYRFKKLVGSPLTQFAAVVACAWRKRRLALPEDPSILYDIDTSVASKGKGKKEKLPHSQQFRFLDRAAIIEGDAPAEQSKWRLSTLTDVEEVKQVIRMLPTWATTIMFWTVYAQMTTFSVSQATTMDRHIGPSFEIPAGSLTVFFVGSILVTVPFYDRIVVPVTRRITGNPQGLSSLQRIAVGLVFSILGMCAASLTERKRLSTALANPTAAVVPLVVFWLIPQFFLVGAGVAFMYIGQLDFFLRECPRGMKTMSTGLFLSTLSLGFFLSTALVTIVHKVTGSGGKGAWLTDDLNKGKLHNFYWLLVALSTLNLVAFVAASRGYVYKETRTSVDDAQGATQRAKRDGFVGRLWVELCERMTTLGIAVNLVTYLTGTMHLGNAASANVVTNFLGTSFMLCLLGGFVADTYLGRYLTIAIFTAIQASGVTILTISTAAPGLRPPECSNPLGGGCVRANGTQLGVLFLGLYLTALGTGGLKSSVSGFGSDQFDEGDRAEKKQMMRFFSWFFFFISIGALMAVTVLVYIQDNVGRRWGYGICAVAIVAGLAVFLSGTSRYRFKRLAGSPLSQIASVVVSAWRKRRLDVPDSSMLHDIDTAEGCSAPEASKKKQKLPHTKQFRFLDRAAIVEGDATVDQTKWRLSTLTDVEEVKQVIRMLPTWATTIMFWTVYAQMTTFSVSQASTMDRHIGPSFEIPAGSLTVFFVGSILITVPIYDRIIVPAARRLTGNPQGVTPLQRIAVGLVLSIVAMCAAALTERKRLRAARTDPTAAVVPLTVFWLVPQFLLVGAGEAFTYIGQLDFFLRECPKGMKTMSTGLFLSTLSLGFFLSSALVTIVHKVTGESGKGAWLPDDLNKGKLYDFYWLLAALSVLNLVVFAAAARGYVYKEKRMGDESVNGFLLVGAGEAFTYIGQLDFFLRECPKGMKTMSTGLFLSTLAGLLPELRAGHHSPQGDGGEREGGVAAGRPEQREAVRLLLAAGGAERAEPGGLRGGRQGLRLQGEEDGGRERQRGGAGGGGLLPCMSCSSKTCSV
ncbi:Nitrate transporter 1.1 [Musa troglodytarum]|nr:Nitrate transporter 1.1 [Musa troglodytarum]